MTRNSKYIAMALGAAVLLVGCSAQSPTAPKPTPIPAFNISLTPASTTATAGSFVAVVAQVNSGSGNAADGTAVTFDVTGGHFDVKDGTGAFATEVVRTTASGRASVNITADTAGQAAVLGRVPGDSDQTTVTFTGVAPTPTPTAPPDYTPQIYVLTPNAGPFEGGTRVTISGTGFQAPVQVLFDDIQGQVVSTTYTEVVCISPSITPTAPDTVITKQVTVTNISNGKKSNGVGFRYGVTMFISSFTPMEGPADTPTTVTIFGQGFVAPVSVVASGVAWDVLSVAGTEIVARTKPLADNSHVCSGGSTTFTVTNINSNQSYDSPGSFTYRGVHPLITSVLIGANNLVNQCGGTCAACVTPYTITVRGSGFQTTSTMTVTLDGSAGGSIGPLIANVTDANTLTISVTDLSVFTMATTACSPPAGGTRNVSTPVDVTVRNVRYDCSDRLNGALVVVPCDLVTCALGPPAVTGVAPAFGTVSGATPVAVTGANFNSGCTVSFGGTPLVSPTFISSAEIDGNTPAHTPAGAVTVTVTCGPQTASLVGGFTYRATMDMTIAGTGTGNIAAAPAPAVGISPCSSGTCNWTFDRSPVQFTANPTAPSTFGGWSGATCGCSGTTNPCSVTMDQARACTATFNP